MQWAAASCLCPLLSAIVAKYFREKLQSGTIPLESHEPGLIGPDDRAK